MAAVERKDLRDVDCVDVDSDPEYINCVGMRLWATDTALKLNATTNEDSEQVSATVMMMHDVNWAFILMVIISSVDVDEKRGGKKYVQRFSRHHSSTIHHPSS